jgi:hypothetical protein
LRDEYRRTCLLDDGLPKRQARREERHTKIVSPSGGRAQLVHVHGAQPVGIGSGQPGVHAKRQCTQDETGTDPSVEEHHMDIDRDDLVKQLRDQGHHDKADKAEHELPKKVAKDEHKGLLDKIGIDDSIIDKLPGGLGDKKLKDIL